MKRLLLFPLAVALSLLLCSGIVTGAPTAMAHPLDCEDVPVPCDVVDYPPDCPTVNRLWGPADRSMVCFNPVGEHLFVCDMKADGRHASSYYRGTYDSPGYHGPVKNHNQAGSCTDANFDMPEHTTISYSACWGDANDVRDCTDEHKEVPASNP
jgi:hypothetical protein